MNLQAHNLWESIAQYPGNARKFNQNPKIFKTSLLPPFQILINTPTPDALV